MNEINFRINDIKEIKMSMDVGIKEIYPPIENLEITPTKEEQVFTHENSYGYDEVVVEPIPDEYIIPDGTLDVDANGDIDVTMFRMARVGVYTPPNLQDKEITINENGTHNIKADQEYDGLNQVSVTVDAIEDLTEELNTYNTELTEQEITINEIAETLKTKAIGGGDDEMVKYSTEEQLIGEWIDGKPLYRMTLIKTSTTATTFLDLGKIYDVDYINVVDGCTSFTSSGNTYYVPTSTYEASNNFSKFFIQKTSTNIANIKWTGNSTTGTIYATVEYTKTTD